MLNLLGMKDCEVCEESKKMLDDHNVQYNFMDLSVPDNLSIARRFNVKVAGKYLYDDSNDSIILVSDYIDQIGDDKNATIS